MFTFKTLRQRPLGRLRMPTTQAFRLYLMYFYRLLLLCKFIAIGYLERKRKKN